MSEKAASNCFLLFWLNRDNCVLINAVCKNCQLPTLKSGLSREVQKYVAHVSVSVRQDKQFHHDWTQHLRIWYTSEDSLSRNEMRGWSAIIACHAATLFHTHTAYVAQPAAMLRLSKRTGVAERHHTDARVNTGYYKNVPRKQQCNLGNTQIGKHSMTHT